VNEIAVLIKAALQHDGVPMWIPPQEVAEGLKAKYGSTFHRGSRGFVEISLDDIEDEPAHLGEELSVMAEEHSQALGQTEREESVGKVGVKDHYPCTRRKAGFVSGNRKGRDEILCN